MAQICVSYKQEREGHLKCRVITPKHLLCLDFLLFGKKSTINWLKNEEQTVITVWLKEKIQCTLDGSAEAAKQFKEKIEK